MRIAVVLVLIAGCDQIYGLTGRGDTDAAVDDAMSTNDDSMAVDAGCANRTFDPTHAMLVDGPFVGATDPAMTADRLELYFAKPTADGTRILRSMRPSPTAAWGPTSIVPALNSTALGKNDTDPSITADGLRMVFLSTRDSTIGHRAVYEAKRGSAASEWEAMERVTVVGLADVEGLDISADGLTLIVVDAIGAGKPLYMHVRATPQGSFGPAIAAGLGILAPSLESGEQALYGQSSTGIERYTRTGNVFLGPQHLLDGATDPDIADDGQSLVFVRKADERLAYLEAVCPDQ